MVSGQHVTGQSVGMGRTLWSGCMPGGHTGEGSTGPREFMALHIRLRLAADAAMQNGETDVSSAGVVYHISGQMTTVVMLG